MLTYTVTLSTHGRRLDSWLRTMLATAQPAYIQQLIRSGAVTVNGATVSGDSLLRVTDTVALKESARTRQLLAAPQSLIDILHEDDQVVFCNKPARLSVHRTAEHGDMNLVAWGEKAFALRGIAVKLYPVNRLDRDTSGIAVMAKSSSRAGDFGRLFQDGLVTKWYLAVVSGRPAATGVIELPLDGKESRSEYRTLFSAKGLSILAVTPVTGRSHQIRRHLAALGHPVLGDRRYGGRPLRAMDGHALHSGRLELVHPVTGATLRIIAPLSAPFAGYLADLAGEQAGRVLDGLMIGDGAAPAVKTLP